MSIFAGSVRDVFRTLDWIEIERSIEKISII